MKMILSSSCFSQIVQNLLYIPSLHHEQWDSILSYIHQNPAHSFYFYFYNYISLSLDSNKYNKPFFFLRDINKNIFIDEETKERIFNTFCMIQRHKNALNRFLHIYKIKTYKVHNKEDMYLNPIVENNKNTVVIIQQGKKYLFVIKDLMNILSMAIGNCSHFFPNPLTIKNPYNNVPFSKSALYNIYFSIKRSDYIMPILFHHFFITNFDMKCYMVKYEDVIIEEYIKKYVYSNDIHDLYLRILIMFCHSNITIHNDYPEETLVHTMRPILHKFLLSIYCISSSKMNYYHNEWIHAMNAFEKNNPLFGRKIYRNIGGKIISSFIHTTVPNNHSPSFMENHL